jgi:acetate kinase
MGGVDLIIFTGGIGENACEIRAGVCKDMEFMGIDFDFDKNHGLRGKDEVLSKPTSKVKVMSVSTNEELVIALDTLEIVTKKRK